MNVRYTLRLLALFGFSSAHAGLSLAQVPAIQVAPAFKQAAPPNAKPTTTDTKTEATASANPDPKSLDVPEDILKQSRDLAKQLGNTLYRERELASRELAKLGRFAVPALLEAIGNDNPEVVERAEGLLPKAQAQDMKARVACFLADTEGKFEHTLAGWAKFRATTGNTRASRELFAEALKNRKTHQMLLAAEGNPEEASNVLSAFVSNLQGYNRWGGNNEQQVVPKTAELAVALFLESQYSDKDVVVSMPWMWGGGWYSVAQHTHSSSDFQNATRQTPSGKFSEPIRKIMQKWMDTRETANGCNQAYTFAQSMLGGKQALKYGARVLEAESNPNTQYLKQNILMQMGQNKAVEYLPTITKCFEDNLLIWSAQHGGTPAHDIQIRDYALAVALQLTDQKPKDYGFDSTQSGDAKNYNHTTFYFKDERDAKERGLENANGGVVMNGRIVRRAVQVVQEDKEKTDKEEKDKKEKEEKENKEKKDKKDDKAKKPSGDDKRAIAFKKWAEWEAANIKKDENKKNEAPKPLPKKDEPKK
jgi:ketosteroid isomerase-like protein